MKPIVVATALLLASTAAQAEIICTNHGGCRETGGRIFRDGGVNNQQSIVNHRDGQKDSGKRVQIKRNYYGNE